jgi:signal transduction histidine kinase
LAVAKNLELNITLADQHDTSNGFQMHGDRLELKRLITNLLGNSLKFTDSGSISARLTPATTDRPWITIAIADTGTGIPPAEQINLFERFRRGKHKRSNSGLGLYLCKQIVQIHSGKIAVQSIPGQGSTFTVMLPSNLTTTHHQVG